jgi:hypothetical protein
MAMVVFMSMAEFGIKFWKSIVLPMIVGHFWQKTIPAL